MNETFDNAYEIFSEESERRRSIRINQEFASKAMGVVCRLFAILK